MVGHPTPQKVSSPRGPPRRAPRCRYRVDRARRSGAASPAPPTVTTLTLASGLYQPKAPPGATDDYHCTLLNPHVTQNSYIISSQFVPGSAEDHHADLWAWCRRPSRLRPSRNAKTGEKGWTCFGAPALPGASLAQIPGHPLLSVWAPGHGADNLPKGTGITLPAGSLVIMQVHYNLLVGDKPVRNSLILAHGADLDAVAAAPSRPGARTPGHAVPGRGDRSAVQPCGIARQPGAALRRDVGENVNGIEAAVRAQPFEPTGR